MIMAQHSTAYAQGPHGLAVGVYTFLFAYTPSCLFVRELLRLGSEVVMVGNTMPAINDITVTELRSVVEDVAVFCPTIKVRCPVSSAAHSAEYMS